MNVVGVQLKEKGKIYYFNANELNLKKNLTVIVETEKGLQFGKVILLNCNKNNESLKNVIRISTKKDYLQYKNNIREASDAIVKCNSLIKKYDLNMKIIDSSYNFDRSQLVFRFVSDERVDFRNLAKDLGNLYKTRIELRQIGIRDKAKEIGGFGSCGRKLCCCSFLKEFDSVSINMAKNQSLSLNPSKINGVCGRLLCCLKYENDLYVNSRLDLPAVGSMVKNNLGTGKVISVDILNKKYKILTNENEVIEISLEKNDREE